jgi:hypothetical protein
VRTVPDKCPFCESPIMVHVGNLLRSEDGGFATYECKSSRDAQWSDPQWGRSGQTEVCRIREIMLLGRQLNAANERIEALNRGNAAAERILCDAAGVGSGRDVLEWIVAANDRINRLEVALEATAKVIGPPGKSTWVTDDELNNAWELYLKAKEAKP